MHTIGGIRKKKHISLSFNVLRYLANIVFQCFNNFSSLATRCMTRTGESTFHITSFIERQYLKHITKKILCELLNFAKL